MPSKSGRLNNQERTFVEAYAATGHGPYAATVARYAQPPQRAQQNLAKPAIQAEIRRAQVERLTVEGLPLAVDTLFCVMRDPRAPASARVGAAKTVLDRTVGSTDDLERELHEMTPEQLDRRLQELWAQRADLAKLVEGKVTEPAKQESIAQPAPNLFD